MDVQYINPFLNATVKVLETMAFLKVSPGKPYSRRTPVPLETSRG